MVSRPSSLSSIPLILDEQHPPDALNGVLKAVILISVSFICLLTLERTIISNGFQILPGDRYDAVIVSVILEHWFYVFRGDAWWTDIGFFYPYKNTLAHSDAYLLNGLLYAPFRVIGLDRFLSAHLTIVPIQLFGFLSFYFFARKCGASFGWAVTGAVIFTLSNAVTSKSSRIQLASIALAPFLAQLVWNTLSAIYWRNYKAILTWGSASAFTFALWCVTCFYMAWSFFFLCVVCFLVMARMVERDEIGQLFRSLRSAASSLVAVAVVTAVCMYPFVSLYLPKAAETGVRSLQDAIVYAVRPVEIFQVGLSSILFGDLTQTMIQALSPGYAPGSEYYNTGVNILLGALFAVACVSLIRNRASMRDDVLASLAIAALITWATTIKFGDASLWFAVYQIIPGAQALRVVSIYQMFLIGPVTLLVVVYLSRLPIPPTVAVVMAGLLIIGELNNSFINLDRNAELARLAGLQPPPSECRSFYVSGWAEQVDSGHVSNIYAHNVSAMVASQIVGIPTINGIASFNPPDWNFANPHTLDYDARVIAYVKSRAIEKGLCQLDLNHKTWKVVS